MGLSVINMYPQITAPCAAGTPEEVQAAPVPKAKAKGKAKAKATPKASASGVTPVDPMGPEELKKELGTLSGSTHFLRFPNIE